MDESRTNDTILTVATVLYLLFLPLYPLTASLMEETTSNGVIAAATVVNVFVTAVYAFFTGGCGGKPSELHRPWLRKGGDSNP